MSNMRNLIKKICPNGIKYYFLSDLEDNNKILLGRGNVISKIDIKENPGDYPVYSSSTVGNGEIGRYGKYMFDDIRISWSIDGGGRFFYRDEPRYSITNVSGWIKVLDNSFIDTKYLYYALTNAWTFKTFNYTYKAHPSVIRKEYNIPIPPIEVQKEIVKILDKFSELEAELETELKTELEVRKNQYEFWRRKLFENENVNYLKIGSFAKCCAGATPSTTHREYWDNGTIAWMSSGEVNNVEIYSTEKKITELGYKSSSTKLLPVNTVVVALAGQGKTRGSVAIIRTEVCTNQSLCGIIPDERVDNEYLFYYLQSRYNDLRRISSGDGTRGGLNLKMINEYEIPVPDLKKQHQIVSILNKFSKTINSYMDGLPAEIELRRKQYEYYRNKLLSFEELNVNE